MPTLTVAFCRDSSLASVIVRIFTGWASWVHCGVVVGNSVVEALISGVTATPLDEWKNEYPTHELTEIECEDPRMAEAFAVAQIGKGYDWLGCIGAPWRSSWHEDNKWYCSELVEAALMAGGRTRFRLEKNGVTPMEVWNTL